MGWETGALLTASRAFRSHALQASCSTACLQSTIASASLSDGIESIFAGQLQQQRWMAVPKRKVPFSTMDNASEYLGCEQACKEIDGNVEEHANVFGHE